MRGNAITYPGLGEFEGERDILMDLGFWKGGTGGELDEIGDWDGVELHTRGGTRD